MRYCNNFLLQNIRSKNKSKKFDFSSSAYHDVKITSYNKIVIAKIFYYKFCVWKMLDSCMAATIFFAKKFWIMVNFSQKNAFYSCFYLTWRHNDVIMQKMLVPKVAWSNFSQNYENSLNFSRMVFQIFQKNREKRKKAEILTRHILLWRHTKPIGDEICNASI